jgi:hypothetical protein
MSGLQEKSLKAFMTENKVGTVFETPKASFARARILSKIFEYDNEVDRSDKIILTNKLSQIAFLHTKDILNQKAPNGCEDAIKILDDKRMGRFEVKMDGSIETLSKLFSNVPEFTKGLQVLSELSKTGSVKLRDYVEASKDSTSQKGFSEIFANDDIFSNKEGNRYEARTMQVLVDLIDNKSDKIPSSITLNQKGCLCSKGKCAEDLSGEQIFSELQKSISKKSKSTSFNMR